MAVSLTVNGQQRTLDIESDTPLLWVLRDELSLKGTKFGCGAGLAIGWMLKPKPLVSRFTVSTELNGMVYAVVSRPPRYGARVHVGLPCSEAL